MLLALSVWIIPTPVHPQAKTAIKVHEPHAVKEQVKELTPPVHVLDNQTQKPVTKKVPVRSRVPSLPKTETSGRSYSKEEVKALIVQYSQQYGIPAEVPLCIAQYESGFNATSKNKSSSASGVFQFLAASTWKNTAEGKQGLSPFDADANVRAAVRHMAVHKDTTPWVVHNKCPKL